MADARRGRDRLDTLDGLEVYALALAELAARARRDGDAAVALLAEDAETAALALLDGLAWCERTVPLRRVRGERN